MVDLCVCVRARCVYRSSSKQKAPGLLFEKQASDDGYAATQMGYPYWAEFYSKSKMSQWF